MQQISFNNITNETHTFDIIHEVEKAMFIKSKCPECYKRCKTKRGCLITQIQNEINKERLGTKYKPVTFPYLAKKFPKSIPDGDIAWALSTARDGKKTRNYPFGKAIFGMVKPR